MDSKKKKSFAYIQMNPRYPHVLSATDYETEPKSHNRTEPPVETKADKILIDALYGLLRTLHIGKDKRNYAYTLTMQGCGYGREDAFVIPADTARAFFKLYEAVSEHSSQSYNKGLKQGKNLLVGLNNGSLTLNDFNNNKEEEEDE